MVVSESNNWNDKVIAEFRANEGKVGGPFEGAPLLLLQTTGAKSGQQRISPLVYLADGDHIVIFGSNAGRPRHSAWYHNILANPSVTIEIGTDKYDATASVVTGEERERLWKAQVAVAPYFADYQAKTDREIPVIVLERTG
jgi:deazaflavin-dependent oxidoreductase (nitroreductase family)